MKTSKFAAAICIGLVLSGGVVSSASAGTDAGIEVGFSPDGSGEALVLRSISSARQSIRLAPYSFTAPAPATAAVFEVGFSPDVSGEALVLRSISSARQSIRLAAYSFTAAPVARALVDAKKRGVDVA